MPKLDGKVSLVTGGTSGIGLAAANALAKEGAHVYITGRREPELRTAVQQIGRNATGVRGDVSKAHDLDRLFAQIKDEKGLAERLCETLTEQAILADLDRREIDRLRDTLRGVPLYTVPRLRKDVHDLAGLWQIDQYLGGE